jgi:hypothetical protein
VRRLLIIAGLLFVGCAGFITEPVGRGRDSRINTQLVNSFVNGFGQSRGTRLVRLFAENAGIEIKGVGMVAQGITELRDFLDYGRAVNSRLTLSSLRIEDDSVFGKLAENNEWLKQLGLEPMLYDATFVLEGNKIKQVIIEVDPVYSARLMGKGLAFFNWLRQNEPEALKELMPDGKFRFDAENGKFFLELIKRWYEQN